jgi:transposase
MVAKWKNYPAEFKRDAVDLVRSSKDRTLTEIARSLGIHLETLRKWVREGKARTQAADGGGNAGMPPRRERRAQALSEPELQGTGAAFGLPASGFRLPASGFRLPASGFRLPASGFRLPASG